MAAIATANEIINTLKNGLINVSVREKTLVVGLINITFDNRDNFFVVKNEYTNESYRVRSNDENHAELKNVFKHFGLSTRVDECCMIW